MITAIEFHYKGNKYKYRNGAVYILGFGTTAFNRNMHYNWIRVKPKGDLKEYIKNTIGGIS